VRDIRRATRKQYSAEEKIRIVLDGLRGTGHNCRTVPPRRHCQPKPQQSYANCIREMRGITTDQHAAYDNLRKPNDVRHHTKM
jgi:hypothetical protein